MLQKLKYWLPAILWMGLIFFVSTDFGSASHTSQFIEPFLHWLNPNISPNTVELVQLIVRKGAHLTEYAILALFALHAVNRSRQHPEKRRGGIYRSAAIALLIAAAYASTDEFHQSFVPSRTPSIYDVLIDTCGAFIALTLVTLWKNSRRKQAADDLR